MILPRIKPLRYKMILKKDLFKDAGKLADICLSDAADGLWGNKDERQKIVLGQWNRAHIATSVEDNPLENLLQTSITLQPTTEIHHALTNYRDSLDDLLYHPSSANPDLFPALAWLFNHTKSKDPGQLKKTIVPFDGQLTMDDQYMVC
ncbi:hypothetical protein VKT23_013028 [Stygiomarasmius scandens]|uniref:Uncharacterized protein n=1 Tax=Marasmiellus scandens TaxID=2682957 RepID=A0ABR1J5K3_9AGAR